MYEGTHESSIECIFRIRRKRSKWENKIDENIKLKDLCEYIVISMHGEKIPFYCYALVK